MEGENSSLSGQCASHGRCQGGPDCGHRDHHARCHAGGVYSWSTSPLEMQHADTPILPVPYWGTTQLVPIENMVIKPSCSPGSPGVEFVEGSSECKVEGTPEYIPTSPSVDWNAIADEIAARSDGDSLYEDSLDELTMSWRYGIGWTEERAICRSSQWEEW
jgi:hypothetical protein